jgi:uncharacterized protein
MRRTLVFTAGALGLLTLLAFLGSAVVGKMLGPGVPHPMVRPLRPDRVSAVDRDLQKVGATRQDFLVHAPDGIVLRGWSVHAHEPNGNWVLLFHGVSDNRTGMSGQAELLLRHGYDVLMMDSRDHGESGGTLATYGWLERRDVQAISDALYAAEMPHKLFELGSSMGAAIALQSAAVEPRISGVVAESSFSDLREVLYDYAGLKSQLWLGETFFRPAVWTALPLAEQAGGFRAVDVSPEKAVAARPFPVLLICDDLDRQIPCRHTERIFAAAAGSKTLWEVPGAYHARALGAAPDEYERRVIAFLDEQSAHDPK